MNAKANKERQRDHYERMKAAGMKKVCVYVHADQVNQLREYADKLRQKSKTHKRGLDHVEKTILLNGISLQQGQLQIPTK